MSRGRIRIIALVVLLAGLIVLGKTVLADHFSKQGLRTFADQAGPWGALLLVGAFCLAAILHVPGLVMIAATVAVYGGLWGAVISVCGTIAGVNAGFLFVRAVGGKALATVERPLVKRLLGRLDARPITTVAIIRSIFFMSGPVTTVLALSSVKVRPYVIGTILGMAPVAIVWSVMFHFVL